MPTLVLCKIEVGREFDNIPNMTMWLDFKILTYNDNGGRTWGRIRVTVNMFVFTIFEVKFVSMKALF